MPDIQQVDVNKIPETFGTGGAHCAPVSVARHHRGRRNPMVWGESTCRMSGIRLQVFSERIQALMLSTRTSSGCNDPHERNSNTHKRYGV